MTSGKDPERGVKPAMTREDRLKAALKANLARRKAQGRVRRQDDTAANNAAKDTEQDKDR